ncbi:N-acetylmuramic acid 6-phosphate etherase [Brevibacillus migulae]|uniref:N-acetylmuramic acid 6-phosphate etherase n=1 Tax=Brevibacillus migulae TaxID=1644114 RepID=UPI00106E5A59|nr:N-acetylmuramic acid 6-phosphate etherase [Brevibacillus migulae]
MLDKLVTETRNERTMNLDEMSIMEVLQVMNEEDSKVPQAIKSQLPKIEQAIQLVIQSFRKGGRLIYVGAGTSGRLGILDAVECQPTFGTDFDMVRGLIAGGTDAFTTAVEGAEDDQGQGAKDLEEIHLSPLDTVIGIAASGRTPYVIGALQHAKRVGASTASLACNKDAEISRYADVSIEVVPGPEILTGSTRLKAGSAQKLVLNMISTCSMIGIGKVYKNLMVDVQPTNQKLVERSKLIIMQATDASYEEAAQVYEQANGNVKAAIVMVLTRCSYAEAVERLEKAEGFVRKAI